MLPKIQAEAMKHARVGLSRTIRAVFACICASALLWLGHG